MRRLHLRYRDHDRSTESEALASVRLATADDADALERLAGLESRHPPGGPTLLAEVDGEPRAALSLIDGTVLADPFHPAAGVVELLRERAAELPN